MKSVRWLCLGAFVAGMPFFGACTSVSTATLTQISLPSPPPRGKIDRLSLVETITAAAMNADPNSAIISKLGGPPRCDVALYAIDYETIGVRGERANASAALFVPQSACGTGPFPLIGYAHGTNVVRAQKITDPGSTDPRFTPPDQLPVVIAAIFAAHGYVTVATDYLGLGDSTYPFHPYLHALSEASSVVDSLRAARNAAKSLNLALSGKVLLTGHSQGGHSAVATQRVIEALGNAEFNLAGDAPSSGPYALTQTFLDEIAQPGEDAPILATYVLTAYQKIYKNLYTNGPADVFLPPYASTVDSLLPVATFQDELALEGQTLPLALSALLQPSFVSSFTSNSGSPARVAAAANDLLTSWRPSAPVFLCGGSRDPEVEFKNSLAAQAYFSSVGASSTLLDVNPYISQFLPSLPIQEYHVTVADFCLTLARAQFFDSLSKARKPFTKHR
jgi:pimeloyl-ACP methyl ester carboxylesterase